MSAAGGRLESVVNGRRVAVVGVGNRLRGDDAAGPWVAERLAARGVRAAFDAGTVPENFIGPVVDSGAQVALFVDAAAHGARPGDWCIVPLDALAPRAESTHAASLALCGLMLESRGVECWLVGIEPGALGLGDAMTPAVQAGARVVEAVLAERLGAVAAAPYA